jgi:hypothetical protein
LVQHVRADFVADMSDDIQFNNEYVKIPDSGIVNV